MGRDRKKGVDGALQCRAGARRVATLMRVAWMYCSLASSPPSSPCTLGQLRLADGDMREVERGEVDEVGLTDVWVPQFFFIFLFDGHMCPYFFFSFNFALFLSSCHVSVTTLPREMKT